MNKLELNWVAIDALKKSIRHWEKDIIKPLREGRKIYIPNMSWKDTGKKLKYRGEHCELCRVYGDDCRNCPYYLSYGHVCDFHGVNEGHWVKFSHNPSLRTAVAMKKSLERILNNRRKV